ncbi:MAG: hypothetical protein Q9188_002372 [Gyalolechia gomerana]
MDPENIGYQKRKHSALSPLIRLPSLESFLQAGIHFQADDVSFAHLPLVTVVPVHSRPLPRPILFASHLSAPSKHETSKSSPTATRDESALTMPSNIQRQVKEAVNATLDYNQSRFAKAGDCRSSNYADKERQYRTGSERKGNSRHHLLAGRQK